MQVPTSHDGTLKVSQRVCFVQEELFGPYKYFHSLQAPANHDGTLEVSQRVCFVQETLFGPSWTFTSDQSRGDTAYTTMALGAHTDNTYFMAPSGYDDSCI